MAKILIIDDDQSILRLLEFTLRRAGHTVFVSEDGIAGLAEAEASRPDLMVVDVMMPRMNGFEFCRQARRHPDLQETPIVMFSARYQGSDRRTALEAGANDYLSKTTSPNDLLKRLADLLPAKTLSTGNMAIGMLSLRGGCGATSLAVNLAVATALKRKSPTVLVDLGRLGGHAALMLGLQPRSSVAQALSSIKGGVTLDALKPYLLEHESGIHLLSSANSYDYELRPTHKRLEPLLAALKAGYPHTVLDLPHFLEPGFASSLQLVDKIIILLSPDMASLQSTAMATQGLARLGITEDNIALVVNHVQPGGDLPTETIQKITKRSILAHIPHEPQMIESLNQGIPLVLHSPNSTGALAITKLADILFG